MAYRIVDAEWKAIQVTRIEAILLGHMVRGQTYSAAELRQVLHLRGLDYTTAELTELVPDVLANGKIEEV